MTWQARFDAEHALRREKRRRRDAEDDLRHERRKRRATEDDLRRLKADKAATEQLHKDAEAKANTEATNAADMIEAAVEQLRAARQRQLELANKETAMQKREAAMQLELANKETALQHREAAMQCREAELKQCSACLCQQREKVQRQHIEGAVLLAKFGARWLGCDPERLLNHKCHEVPMLGVGMADFYVPLEHWPAFLGRNACLLQPLAERHQRQLAVKGVAYAVVPVCSVLNVLNAVAATQQPGGAIAGRLLSQYRLMMRDTRHAYQPDEKEVLNTSFGPAEELSEQDSALVHELLQQGDMDELAALLVRIRLVAARVDKCGGVYKSDLQLLEEHADGLASRLMLHRLLDRLDRLDKLTAALKPVKLQAQLLAVIEQLHGLSSSSTERKRLLGVKLRGVVEALLQVWKLHEGGSWGGKVPDLSAQINKVQHASLRYHLHNIREVGNHAAHRSPYPSPDKLCDVLNSLDCVLRIAGPSMVEGAIAPVG
ncbi:hypothetical protein OEZ85_002352 [Tetradesmus obliquus]|uniref:DUF4145 domain-containing protein n=1 Tax=Tetradesmus obliquus TaxID=3088 RepID=A0ABY8U2W9_TETOB|nr:hypothetical protein OEZ85_002352 [Tetradesmus obliquus]